MTCPLTSEELKALHPPLVRAITETPILGRWIDHLIDQNRALRRRVAELERTRGGEPA